MDMRNFTDIQADIRTDSSTREEGNSISVSDVRLS